MNRTPEDVAYDAIRLDFGDKDIRHALDKVYEMHQLKGLPYHELWASKITGNIKYMITVTPPPEKTVTATDLDTNITYIL